MTAKEKAKELYYKFYEYAENDSINRCALIAADEAANVIDNFYEMPNTMKGLHTYWDNVKEEINKLGKI